MTCTKENRANFGKRIYCSHRCSMIDFARKRDYHKDKNPRWQGGAATHPLYQIWGDMKARCNRPTHRRFADYGGRGITVCSSWQKDFWAFVQDMGPRPEGVTPSGRATYSLDRINNDGNYEPGNCRWATNSEQALNQRPRKKVTS